MAVLRMSAAVLWTSVLCCAVGTPIDGPQPKNIVAPLNTKITFTCIVNITEMTLERFFDIAWAIDGVPLPADSNQNITENGLLRIGLLQLSMSENTLVFVQCVVLVRDAPWSSTITAPFKSENATFTTYGENLFTASTLHSLSIGPPEAPSDLSSTQSSDNALILSWSAPSSPVQLHYTVTVWTNTSTITMFNTSSTTITISRDNITTSDSTSECDQYVWSVTAINPAGTSTPTNITAPLSFVPGMSSISMNLCTKLLLFWYRY